MYNRLHLNEYFFIQYCNKWAGIHARNINITSFVIPLFFSFCDEALPKCRTELLQFMWCISKNISRRIAKILPCI